MLAFDFRLIYNPTWLCLMVYLESRQRWSGKAAASGVARAVGFPPGREAAGRALSLWCTSSSSVANASARAHRRVLGPATTWRGDAESQAFLGHAFSPLSELGFGGKGGRWLGYSALAFLDSFM